MNRAARLSAGWVALACIVALGVTGCGSTTRHAPFPVSTLCVAVGLSPVTPAGKAMLAGLERVIPVQGVDDDGYKIRLCDIGDGDGGGAAGARSAGARGSHGSKPSATDALLANAVHAASDNRTIAYIGALSSQQASAADAVLAAAGIPLITPSGPGPLSSGTAAPSSAAPAGVQPRSSAFYLLPSLASQSEAITDARRLPVCDVVIHRHRQACEVLDSARYPLCTGIATAASRRTTRVCVLAGPDLSRFDPPAIAYGYSAGALLQETFAEVGAAGGDIASRRAVMRRLIHADLQQSPIGPIRFDGMGGIKANHFTVYTVQQNGRLLDSETFNAH